MNAQPWTSATNSMVRLDGGEEQNCDGDRHKPHGSREIDGRDATDPHYRLSLGSLLGSYPDVHYVLVY